MATVAKSGSVTDNYFGVVRVWRSSQDSSHCNFSCDRFSWRGVHHTTRSSTLVASHVLGDLGRTAQRELMHLNLYLHIQMWAAPWVPHEASYCSLGPSPLVLRVAWLSDVNRVAKAPGGVCRISSY
jgi:hypothetical protein